jgi:F0F1-type ATP synthase membrane subunit a
MINNKYAAFGLFIVLFLVFSNVLDFVYSVLITKSAYAFSPASDLGVPLVLAIVLGYVLILGNRD